MVNMHNGNIETSLFELEDIIGNEIRISLAVEALAKIARERHPMRPYEESARIKMIQASLNHPEPVTLIQQSLNFIGVYADMFPIELPKH